MKKNSIISGIKYIMSYTIEQYDSLVSAIATGALSVRYGDKSVTYNSVSDMLRVKRLMEIELFPAIQPVRRKYAEYNSGITPQSPDWTDEHLR